jgi:hypothetical protein
MPQIITVKEIKKTFYEFVRDYNFKLSKKKNFKDFLGFLEIDFYDWVRENLKSYFKNDFK